MRFLGKVWRLLVGIKDALVLALMLLFFGGLFALLSARPTLSRYAEGALVLDIGGTIVEQPAEADPLALLSGSAITREYRLRDMVKALEAAATDDRVKAVSLDLAVFVGGGQSTISDVGAAIDKVRRAGKPVLAYATGYGDDAYLLASHASEVWLDPLGAVLIMGPGGANLYYKGLLDKLGVTANIYRVGTYKSAVEPYSRSDMSPEARQATQALADSLWGTWRAEVRGARPKAQVDAYVADTAGRIATAGGDMARAAQAAGLIDRIGDREAYGRRLAQLAGTDTRNLQGGFKAIAYDDWAAANPVATSGPIGILTVAGTIVDGTAGPGSAGAETIAENIRRGLSERNLKALVVRIDSPGGSALASERIRQAILEAKRRRLPVVVSMGSVAASGGYWIATAGDHIFAEPETITGSIGVFGVLPSFEGTLAKIGVGADGVRTTPLSGEPDVLRGPSPEANRLLQLSVESTYRRFIGLVSRSRDLPPGRVAQIAEGRVWDGGTARQLGLVDQFGTLEDAIAEAARRANLNPATADAVWLEQPPSFAERLVAGVGARRPESGDAFSRLAARPQQLLARALADVELLLDGPAIQLRCLECPPVGAIAGDRPVRPFWARLAALLAQ